MTPTHTGIQFGASTSMKVHHVTMIYSPINDIGWNRIETLQWNTSNDFEKHMMIIEDFFKQKVEVQSRMSQRALAQAALGFNPPPSLLVVVVKRLWPTF